MLCCQAFKQSLNCGFQFLLCQQIEVRRVTQAVKAPLVCGLRVKVLAGCSPASAAHWVNAWNHYSFHASLCAVRMVPKGEKKKKKPE